MTAKKIIKQKKTELVALGTNDKEIAAVAKKYKGLVIGDNKTFESCKAARTHTVSMRTSIDKAFKAGVKPFKDAIALNKEEAARLTALVVKIETPLQETVKAWEKKKAEEKAEKERVELERITNHKKTLSEIANLGNVLFGETIEAIENKLNSLNSIIIDDSLEEFEIEAKGSLSASRFMIESALHGAKEQAKQDEARRVESDRLEKEREKLEARQAKIDADNLEIKLKQQEKEKELQAKQDAIDAQKKEDEEKLKFLSIWDSAIKEDQEWEANKKVIDTGMEEKTKQEEADDLPVEQSLEEPKANKRCLIDDLEEFCSSYKLPKEAAQELFNIISIYQPMTLLNEDGSRSIFDDIDK